MYPKILISRYGNIEGRCGGSVLARFMLSTELHSEGGLPEGY